MTQDQVEHGITFEIALENHTEEDMQFLIRATLANDNVRLVWTQGGKYKGGEVSLFSKQTKKIGPSSTCC